MKFFEIVDGMEIYLDNLFMGRISGIHRIPNNEGVLPIFPYEKVGEYTGKEIILKYIDSDLDIIQWHYKGPWKCSIVDCNYSSGIIAHEFVFKKVGA